MSPQKNIIIIILLLFTICHLSHVFSLQATTAVTFEWEKPRFIDF